TPPVNKGTRSSFGIVRRTSGFCHTAAVAEPASRTNPSRTGHHQGSERTPGGGSVMRTPSGSGSTTALLPDGRSRRARSTGSMRIPHEAASSLSDSPPETFQGPRQFLGIVTADDHGPAQAARRQVHLHVLVPVEAADDVHGRQDEAPPHPAREQGLERETA